MNTVPFGSPATVVNSGTINDAILDFEIPQGQDGDITFDPYIPTGSGDTGTIGTMSTDTDYLYIVVATDTWRKIPLSLI